MNYLIEFGGGLGDILNQIYRRGSYQSIAHIQEQDHLDVILITHNPHSVELFEHHPKRKQMTIYSPGYCFPHEGPVFKLNHGVPLGPENLPRVRAPVEFYPYEEDIPVLASVPRPYIVLAAGAGIDDRNIPEAIYNDIIDTILEKTNYTIACVGRTYDRHDDNGRIIHTEPIIAERPRVVSLIDKLSVPGSCLALKDSAGLITAHSALNLLGWHMLKPQLLLYPDDVLARHRINPPDEWMFGIQYPNTVHSRFSAYTKDITHAFISKLGG